MSDSVRTSLTPDANMSHSKRNTSLAFFTSHERSQLKAHWGTQSTRLTRDSFLPFASCNLCLQSARDAVACAANGDIFCRECAVSNLLAQKIEIKRMEKDLERRAEQDGEREQERGEEERGRAVAEFEWVEMGLEGGAKGKAGKVGSKISAAEEEGLGIGKMARGVKRKFELDEAEMLRNAKEERAKARKGLDEEKAALATLPSFWVPSLTPSTDKSSSAPSKLAPVCPCATPVSPHPISLKSLVSVVFSTTDQNSSSKSCTKEPGPTRICPACTKPLTTGTKAMLAVPCGHVICKSCVGKFMTEERGKNPHDEDEQVDSGVKCYVCNSDLTDRAMPKKDEREGKKNKKSKDKEKLKPGLVEIKSEGTGFAARGTNMAKKVEVAFQC